MLSSPQSLFQYIAPQGAREALSKQTFRFTNPLIFNDCYEGWARSIEITKDYVAENICKEHLATNLYLKRKIIRFIDPLIYKKANECNDISEFMILLNQNKKHYINRLYNVIKKHVLSNKIIHADPSTAYGGFFDIRVTCLSENFNNPLMWGHYAKAGEGCALEFSFKQLSNFWKKGLFKMIYTNSLPSIPSIPSDDVFSIIKRIQYKGIDWSYENEWRIYISKYIIDALKQDPPIDLPNDNAAENHCDLMYRDAKWLKAVYIGPNATLTFQKEIQNIVAQNFPEAKCYIMERDPEYYTFRIKS